MCFFKKDSKEMSKSVEVVPEIGNTDIVESKLEELPYSDKELWDIFNKLKSKCNDVSEDGSPMLYIKNLNKETPYHIGSVVTFEGYRKKGYVGIGLTGVDGIAFCIQHFYSNHQMNYSGQGSVKGYDYNLGFFSVEEVLDGSEDCEIVSKDDFFAYVNSEKEAYRSAFMSEDIKAPWYKIGVISDMSQCNSVYVIRITAKYIDDKGMASVAYSVSDMIHCPNYWKQMPVILWDEFKRIYSKEKPEYFEINVED